MGRHGGLHGARIAHRRELHAVHLQPVEHVRGRGQDRPRRGQRDVLAGAERAHDRHAFGHALTATVTDADGDPVAGVPVTFVAPAGGASGTTPAITNVSPASGSALAPGDTLTFDLTDPDGAADLDEFVVLVKMPAAWEVAYDLGTESFGPA